MRVRINIIDILKFVIVTSLLLVSSTWAASPFPAIPTLASNSRIATAGFYHLTWQGDDLLASAYELQEFNSTAFSQPTTIFSGKNNGQYFYRIIRTLSQGQSISAWSAPISVTVQHYSLARAFAFLAAGATVFLATLAFISFGAWRSQKDKPK